MDSNIVTAASAVLGSMVGASASLGTAWFTQRYQWRRDHLSRQITRRETLYAAFIEEAARLYSMALMQNTDDAQMMATLWSLLSRIRLSASQPVLEAAEQIVTQTAQQFRAPNLTPDQIREHLAAGDPLKAFGDACRVELDDLDTDR